MQAIKPHRSHAEGQAVIDSLTPPPPPTSKHFPALLKRGLGRAVLYLQTRSDAPFRSRIARALWTNLAYDRQCENHRAEYLCDLIHASRDASYYRDRLLKRLQRPRSNDYRTQMMHLAALFAQQGDGEMREAFYKAMERFLVTEHFLYGEKALLSLDGLDGYRRAARLLLQHPLPEEEHWQEGALFDFACETFSKAVVLSLNDEDPVLTNYLERMATERITRKAARKRAPVPTLPSYEELQTLINLPKGEGELWARQWAEQLPLERVQRLWHDMQAETDVMRLRRYLRLAKFVPTLPDVTTLLDLTHHKDAWVSHDAINALEGRTDPLLQAEGLRLLSNPNDHTAAGKGIKLLIGNPTDGDNSLIEVALRVAAALGQGELHAVSGAAQDYFNTNPSPEQTALLLFLYENVACTFCRPYFVEALLKRGPLPEWLKGEGAFDASLQTRSLVAGHGWPKTQ